MQATPAGTVPMTRNHADELQPPGLGSSPQPHVRHRSSERANLIRFNPQTGQPCDGLPQERVVVRQPNAIRTQPVSAHADS